MIILAKKKLCSKYLIIFIPLVAALASVLLKNYFFANICIAVNAFIATGVLLFSYIKSKNKNFLFFSIACFAWAMGEVFWSFLELSDIDPSENILASLIYFVSNCCLLLTFFIFSYKKSSKWNYVQLYIDSLIIGILNFSMIWMVFLNNDLYIMEMMQASVIRTVSVIFDVFLGIVVLAWLFSIRSGKIVIHDKIIFLGILIFSFNDILFFYTDLQGIYFSNSLIDFTYILSLQMIAFGVLLKVFSEESLVNSTVVTNIGNTKSWLYLFIYPLCAYLFEAFDIIEGTVTLMQILLLIVMILLYRAASKYVQISIQNEQLLYQARHMNEILEKRVAEQVAELTYLVNRDTLTTLFNRRHFYRCVDKSINSLSQNDTLAILLIDVDRFKKINDNFGHDVGDTVLIKLSNRLIDWNKIGAELCRLGGDEFAIMIVGSYTPCEIQEFCMELIKFCYEPIRIRDSVINMSVSVGVSLFSEEAQNREVLMKHADMAMYRAKAQGFSKLQFYNQTFNKDFNKNNEIEILLKQINVEKDFELYYQPQFSLPELTLIGAEALIRWNQPKHGYIPPNIFIPIAEEVGRIIKIGKWVIKEAIKQTIIWNKRYQNNLKIGFNISVKQLADDEFINILKTLIMETGVNTAWLDAELTESVMITDGSRVNQALLLMKQLGLSVSIDDFGAGYSSLSYLNNYQFDRIKIDKSLIDQVSAENVNGINIVKAAITMAKAVGVKTIAEGVETQEQLDIITSLGCDEVQGYLLGKPVPADIFEQRFLIVNDAISKKSIVLQNAWQVEYGANKGIVLQ